MATTAPIAERGGGRGLPWHVDRRRAERGIAEPARDRRDRRRPAHGRLPASHFERGRAERARDPTDVCGSVPGALTWRVGAARPGRRRGGDGFCTGSTLHDCGRCDRAALSLHAMRLALLGWSGRAAVYQGSVSTGESKRRARRCTGRRAFSPSRPVTGRVVPLASSGGSHSDARFAVAADPRRLTGDAPNSVLWCSPKQSKKPGL